MDIFEKLALSQTDATLAKVKAAAACLNGTPSWLKTIRRTLGISTYALARMCGTSQARIAAVEKREEQGRVTLQTLNEIAAHLGCEVLYVLVPKDSLQGFVERREREEAVRAVDTVGHTMLLEAQQLDTEQRTAQLEAALHEIRRKPLKSLWNGGHDA